MDINLSKAQWSKLIKSGGFLGKTLGNLGKKVLLDFAVPLIKDVLPKLATKATSSVLDKFERKICALGAARAGKRFTLFIITEDMEDIIKIAESLEKSGLLIDGTTEKVKHEIKKQECVFLCAMMIPMAFSLIQPVASSLINPITGKGQEGRFLPLLALPLMMKDQVK